MDPLYAAAVTQVLAKYNGLDEASLTVDWLAKHAAKAAGHMGAAGGKSERQDAIRTLLMTSR